MTTVRVTTVTAAAILLTSLLSACGGEIRETCDEPQPYQAAQKGKSIEVPEDLDALEEFKEMPLPEAETAPRPAGMKCIDKAPSILSGK